jgi:hypothetical protein
MQEPFSHKNIQNQLIYDIPCLRFDLLQD